ncbi:hypothetical protein BOTBODRAFT_39223 [Botryobasidium botryosum FD-172 SS1]|uniref:TNFR-Cys domain-containing protein n=1 Tax=Botryobasidium botryosum (strain FD-172 SS1) TaxID=930990 RepID=A0A067LUD9_BOTB1|nr:hypothetical protein BOTBODRAFT_39223 [Botryobasidium botryosum FD-172 SS1]
MQNFKWGPFLLWFSTLFALALINFPSASASSLASRWEGTSFCKCICFSNYTILPLLHPASDSKPCLSCTKQWCLDQKLLICKDAELGDQDPDTATGKEGDVEARCFQRDSPRDQVVVTLFLVIVFGLLLGAAVKNRMERAGIRSVPGRRWWEMFFPSRAPGLPEYQLRSNSSPVHDQTNRYTRVAPDET